MTNSKIQWLEHSFLLQHRVQKKLIRSLASWNLPRVYRVRSRSAAYAQTTLFLFWKVSGFSLHEKLNFIHFIQNNIWHFHIWIYRKYDILRFLEIVGIFEIKNLRTKFLVGQNFRHLICAENVTFWYFWVFLCLVPICFCKNPAIHNRHYVQLWRKIHYELCNRCPSILWTL